MSNDREISLLINKIKNIVEISPDVEMTTSNNFIGNKFKQLLSRKESA